MINRIAKLILSSPFKQMQVPFLQFLQVVPKDRLNNQINYMYSGLLDLCKDNINNININSIKNFPRAKIFNFTVLDYLKYNILTNELLNSKYSGLNEQWNKLNYYLPSHDTIYTLLDKQSVQNLIQSHITQLNKEYLLLQRIANNRIIAKVYGKFDEPKKLTNINDKIGDTVQLTNNAIVDVGDRDKLFVYCAGIWEDSNDEVYHSHLVAIILNKLANAKYYYNDIAGGKIYTTNDIINFVKYINEENNDDENNENNESIDDNKAASVLAALETKPLFFGNIADGIGYLISTKNISKKTAAELIKNHYQVKKVYFQQQNTYKYTRLAKRIL